MKIIYRNIIFRSEFPFCEVPLSVPGISFTARSPDHISQAFQGGLQRERTVLAGVKRKSMGFVEDNQAMLIFIWFMVNNVFEKMRR